jgi:hypothetical protein
MAHKQPDSRIQLQVLERCREIVPADGLKCYQNITTEKKTGGKVTDEYF